MVDFAKWRQRLAVLTVQGLDARYDVDAPGSPLYTLPQSWRDAAIEILGRPVQDHNHFKSRPGAVSGEIKPRKLEPRKLNMKKSRDKSSDTDDLDEMREAFKRHTDRQNGGGSGKNDWDKLGDGKNLRYFLPRPGEKKFYTEGWTHFDVGPSERAVRCIDEAHIDPDRNLPTSGTKCPRCKRFLREQARINSEYQKGDAEGQAEWGRMKQKYVPRHQFYSNVLREDDEGDYEVKIHAYGPQIWGQLMNYYVGDDSDVGDFTNPKSGTWMNVKKEDKGGNKSGRRRKNVEYKVFPVKGPDISAGWSTIKEALHDLDAAIGKLLSVEEFIAIEKGTDVDKDSDDASDGSSNKRRRSSKEDDDEDEDEDADRDEEDGPVSKKSKLAAKRRRRDD